LPGPLDGLRVLDFTEGTAGIRASWLLADYGADVVAVETPGGTQNRRREDVEYSVFMRGKRSVELDASTPAGRDALLGLLEDADVLLEDAAPDGSEAFVGLSGDELTARFPHLIRCTFSAFGPQTEFGELPAYEQLIHAVAGTNYEQIGHRDGPIFEALPFASLGTAYLGVIGILTRLYGRAQHGLGGPVETSLLDGAHAYLTMLYSMQWGQAAHSKLHSEMDLHSPIPTGTRLVTGAYQCADGEWLGVHTGAVGAFGRLMTLVGLADRVPPSESGMDMGMPLTPDERLALNDLYDIFASEPRDVWVKRLVDADVCGMPVNLPGRVLDEPQALHNQMVIKVDDPDRGVLEQIAPAAKFAVSKAPGGTFRPRPGQHTDEVLAGLKAGSAWLGERAFLGSAEVTTDAPLAGVKIVDLGAYFAGPYSSRLLAGLGADVVKVEPVRGDQFRGTLMFRAAQAGKRSVAIDLRDPEARTAAYSLLAKADIVCHNMRPGAAGRLGVDYDDIREINPNVIYGHAVGWGTEGPNSSWQSFEPMMSGYVGVEFEVAGRYNSPLYPAGNADPGNGLLGAAAMLMALLHRQRTGEGQHFVNSQLNATMTHLAHIVRDEDGNVIGAGRLDPMQYGYTPVERMYMTSDGWVSLVVRTEEEYAGLLNAFGLENAPTLAESMASTEADDGVGPALEAALGALTTADALRTLKAAGVPALEPQHYDNTEFMTSEANRAVGRVVEFDHPTDGLRREVARLLRMAGANLPEFRGAPALGEHTREVLLEAGCPSELVDRLEERGIAKNG
jgi:crotonobetainyl-CoA:carnitine CoA-transferase CaiB-like acyl-CoA transferase